MASFKISKKDALSDTRTTLYDLHTKKLEYFDSEKKNLNKYVSELEEIKNSNSIRLKELEQKIYNIKNDIELNDYLLDFVSLLNKEQPSSLQQVNNTTGKMDSYVNSKIDNSKSKLYNNYIRKFYPELKFIDDSVQNILPSECKNCKSDTFVYESRTSSEICTKCGLTDYVFGACNDSTPVYTDCCEQVSVFNYKRNNHFQECLNQLQAKENTNIPPKIIEELLLEFKKYNITNPKLFTASLVKSYLKKLKYNKYYEHIPTIINEICGLRAPKMTPELEEQLKIMFDEIQDPFEKYSKIISPNRKNFLNYNYIFYKMCQLLNKDEFLKFFPLLKSRENLYEHDLIWKGICNDLRWEFIPSI